MSPKCPPFCKKRGKKRHYVPDLSPKNKLGIIPQGFALDSHAAKGGMVPQLKLRGIIPFLAVANFPLQAKKFARLMKCMKNGG